MNRRNFLGLLAGTAAAWPFRKYFIPPAPRLFYVDSLAGIQYFCSSEARTWRGLDRTAYPGRLCVPLRGTGSQFDPTGYTGRFDPEMMRRIKQALEMPDEPMLKDLVLHQYDPSWPATTKRT